jgi:predicted enzyme related to lactoylglutathione lyase
MHPHVSFLTLAVSDLHHATQFYNQGLGWPIQAAPATSSASVPPTTPRR